MWLYKNKEVKKAPLDYVGYVYRVTVSDSKDLPEEMRGRIYIGKKWFNHTRKRKLSKKKKAGTRKKVEIVSIDSKWLTYFGSSKAIIQDVKDWGPQYFKREILHFCYTKQQCSYYELVEMINHEVMFCNSYNGWISAKIFRNKFLQKLIEE